MVNYIVVFFLSSWLGYWMFFVDAKKDAQAMVVAAYVTLLAVFMFLEICLELYEKWHNK